MLATIDPDPTVSYSGYTPFMLTFPSTHGGIVVIGDVDFPYTTYNDISQCFIWNYNSVYFSLNKTTRIRIYYVLIDPMTVIESEFDDFIITITDVVPTVSLANYGNVVTFPSSTTAIIEVDMPCTVTYKLSNFDTGQVNTETVEVAVTHEIVLNFNGSLVLNAVVNGLNAKEQAYYFKKEPEGTQTVYTAWADGTVDNFTGMAPFGE
jgi:hypothetical protein